ncbi:MAG: hypothetical protein LBJ90_07755 [Treponema sp.]|nr:hypothetical protein [Treponema sp.]
MKNRQKGRILGFLAACFFLTAAASCLYAGGKKDKALSDADDLIRRKEYNAALEILSAYSKENPDNFEEAQRRIRQIYRIRGEFNSVAGELLDMVADGSIDNAEKVLELTNRLRELESSSNPQLAAFITRIRDLAQFAYNRSRLDRILVEGRDLIDRGNFAQALVVYAGGMDLYQDDFFNSGYGSVIEEGVFREIENVNRVIRDFPSAAQSLGALASSFTVALEREEPFSRLDAAYAGLDPAVERFTVMEGDLFRTAAFFDLILAQLQQQDSSIGDRSFLSFAMRLIRGRSDQGVPEGMLGAIEGFWNSSVGAAESAAGRLAESVYSRALDAAFGRDYTAARSDFESAGGYAEYPLGFIEKRFLFKEAGNLPRVEIFDRAVPEESAGSFLKYESMSQAINYLISGSELGDRYDGIADDSGDSVDRWRAGTDTAEDAMDREQGYRDNYEVLLDDIESLLDEVNQRAAELEDYRNRLEDRQDADILRYINNAQTLVGGIHGMVLAVVQDSAIRYYTIANGEFEKNLDARRDEFAEGNQLIEGISRVTENDNTVVDHFPMEGLAGLTGMLEAITGNSLEGSALLSRYEGERGEIAADNRISDLQGSARAMVDELASLGTRGQGLAAAARNQVAQAEAYRIDGDRLYREAEAALAQQNFDRARDRLQLTAERYNNSLGIQESSSLRDEWDTRLVVLGQEINRLENEVVVREVRNMVTNAQETYFAGNFERAEDLLVRAQNRWHVTNIEDNEEVLYWLGVIRGALSLRSGRIISPTAPLYPEMSQLLSEAKRNYDEGVRYITAGQRTLGLAKFGDARQKTQEVKLMFPVNQEAGMLELRMDQLTDLPAFNASFDRRVQEARAGTRRRSVEAFADLQNLAEINPRYTNMTAILGEAEIDMGYRLPPPNPRDLARSAELTQAARQVLDGNIRAQYEVALRQVTEAITLNPNNAAAAGIKDRLQILMGGNTEIVMDSNTRQEYDRALREFTQRNYLVANAIVQQILQNPRNRNIPQIIELQRRIQSLL